MRLEWQDLAAAVRLASRHMSQVLNGKPLYVIGYSTGASLALNHELENLHSGRPTDYEKVVMLSPAIGLAPMAMGAQWQSQLGYILGLEKLSWNTISPEYDPFKYSSFAVNAGDVVYRLAQHNSQRLLALPEDKKRQLPPILAFQSLVDDSVSTRAVLENLFLQLPKGANELVIYDMNRSQVNLSMTPVDPLAEISGILARTNLAFRGTLIENQVALAIWCRPESLVLIPEWKNSTSNGPCLSIPCLMWPCRFLPTTACMAIRCRPVWSAFKLAPQRPEGSGVLSAFRLRICCANVGTLSSIIRCSGLKPFSTKILSRQSTDDPVAPLAFGLVQVGIGFFQPYLER